MARRNNRSNPSNAAATASGAPASSVSTVRPQAATVPFRRPALVQGVLGATRRRVDTARAANSATLRLFKSGEIATAGDRQPKTKEVRHTAAAPAATRDTPEDRNKADVCKPRPARSSGNGRSRPFVPWCK